MLQAGRFIARERGAFDADGAPSVAEKLPCGRPLWESAFRTMDTDTLIYLAELFECTVSELTRRYE